MEQPRLPAFTADEFIAWALEQPAGRFELSNGVVVAMAPERASHNQAKLNTAVALRGAIGARGLPCRAMTDGMAVRIDDRTVYEPDALVRWVALVESMDPATLEAVCQELLGPDALVRRGAADGSTLGFYRLQLVYGK